MFSSLINLMGMMFFLIVVGFILRKKQTITDTGRKTLTDLILQVIIPANIIKAFLNPLESGTSEFGMVLIIGVLINGFYILLAKVSINKFTKEEKPVYQYGTVCPNAGFIGNPLVEGVFGIHALTYASICMLPARIVMWTAGVSYFNNNEDKKVAYKKVFTSPAMVATYIGLMIMMCKITLPTVIGTTVKSLSDCTTALTMIYVGTILADVELEGLINIKILGYCSLRLIFIPLAIFTTCICFNVNPLIIGVCVLLSSTPAGSTTSLLSAKYGADQKIATKVVVVSTMLSIVTIPIWSMVLLKII